MSLKKRILILIAIALVAGAALGGGVYVISTPTRVAPKASTTQLVPTLVPIRDPTPTSAAAEPTPSPEVGLSEEGIIAAFGSDDEIFDLNEDGVVNTLDLVQFRMKK